MAKRYEGSAKDRREDKAGAAKRGITQRNYEKTAADRRQDAKGQAQFNKRGKVKGYAGGGSAAPSSGSDSSGYTSGSSGSMQTYATNLMNLRGGLGGSAASPYSSPAGGNAMFRKGGPVKAVRKKR
jgi:hypothetical protein